MPLVVVYTYESVYALKAGIEGANSFNGLNFAYVIVIVVLWLMNPSHIRIIALTMQLCMISWLLATVMNLESSYLGQVKASPKAFKNDINLISVR